jgi:hypothetical protein
LHRKINLFEQGHAMNSAATTVLAASALTLGGCAYQNNMPIVFGQSITAGVAIAAGLPEQGAELTVGLTDRSFAIIPVSTTDAKGDPHMLGSRRPNDDKDWDAFSVFGHFSSHAGSAAKTDGVEVKATLGKFFATGLAARNLADGFADGMGRTKVTPKAAALSEAKKAELAAQSHASAAAKSARDAAAAASATVPQNRSATASAESRTVYLLFGQYDAYGLSLSGSGSDLGGGLTLGYRSRNIAIVPTAELFSNGNYKEMLNSSGKDGHEIDSLSVLGQFESDASGGLALDSGLKIFFSTGSAARALGEGFGAKLGAASAAQQQKAQDKPAATKPAAAPANTGGQNKP